jgi:hypothetical protein
MYIVYMFYSSVLAQLLVACFILRAFILGCLACNLSRVKRLLTRLQSAPSLLMPLPPVLSLFRFLSRQLYYIGVHKSIYAESNSEASSHEIVWVVVNVSDMP